MDERTADNVIRIAQLFISALDGNEYHNWDHHRSVVEEAVTIARKEGLSNEDELLLRVATWFHDIGYVNGADDHEKLSTDIANAVLKNNGVKKNSEDSRIIREAIRGTEIPKREEPENKVAAILSDADLANLGKDYITTTKQRMSVYEEADTDLTEAEWNEEMSLPLLEHVAEIGYYTETAQELYGDQLRQNLEYLREEVENGTPDVIVAGTFDVFHIGHEKMFDTAFAHGNPIIGLTSDEMASKSREREVRDYSSRLSGVEMQASERASMFHREYEVQQINSTYADAMTIDADKIIVSPEEKTIERAEDINDVREENGLNTLDIIVAEEVRADDGGRISSTRIRNNEINYKGNIL